MKVRPRHWMHRVVRRVRRHPVRAATILTGLILLTGLAWIVVTGLFAARAASRAEQDLQQLKDRLNAGQYTGLGPLTADLEQQAARAHSLTSGPAWWLVAHVPSLGTPARQVRVSAQAADIVGSRALPELVAAADGIDPTTLRANGHTLRLGPIEAARPHLDRAAAAVTDAVRILGSAPSSGWVSAIDVKLTTLQTELAKLHGYVQGADRGAALVPQLLGADGPRRYFIGLQNEAEMRGTGGIPGAFAILLADHGSLRFTEVGSDDQLNDGAGPGIAHTGLDLGAAYAEAYGHAAPTDLLVNSNVSPDFPQAARIWAAMWERVSHQHVDGAVAVDPTALSYLLAVTGPATMPGGTQVDAANVVDLTERDEYANFHSTAARKRFLVALFRSVAGQLLSGAGDAPPLVLAFGQAAAQNRLQVWSAHPQTESLLASTAMSGQLPGPATPLAAMIVTNIAGTKLDYYLHRSLTVQRLGCGTDHRVQVTMTLTSTAPAHGLPAYVTTRRDDSGLGAAPGSNRVWVDYLAGPGTTLLSTQVDGTPAGVQPLTIAGHPAFRSDLELPASSTTTVVLELDETSLAPPVVWQQPGVWPFHSTVDLLCG